MSTETVKIDRLGQQGDGIAHRNGEPLYVPFALPGEQVAVARVGNQGMIMSIAQASPERREPPCRHFGPDGLNGVCGGCSLQHLDDEPYHAFKRRLVIEALQSKGIVVDVAPLVIARPGERRRVVMTARKTEKSVLLGFNQAQSHHIVSIEECHIASPGIVARLPAIRAIAGAVAANAEPFRITVLETPNGLDLCLDGIAKIADAQRRKAVETVLSLPGIARLSLGSEIIIEPAKPLVDFGGVVVAPPAGGFVQATKPAEEAMAALVLNHIGKAKKVADLFAGAGTFALRIARRASVHAVESDAGALNSLDFAARNTQGLKPVKTERRDLFRRPLTIADLKTFDAVVFDPPRAGAEAQCRELARSKVKQIAAVSCNPLTLARDLAILVAGGYRIKTVVPIDQFLWSTHVEAVALVEKVS